MYAVFLDEKSISLLSNTIRSFALLLFATTLVETLSELQKVQKIVRNESGVAFSLCSWQ